MRLFNDWLIRKHSHTSTILVSLSDIPMIICGADVYSLRYQNSPDKCVSIAGATAEELIAIENDIVYRCSIAENDRVYTNRCQYVGMV